MKAVAFFSALILSSSAFAGVSANQLAKVLEIPLIAKTLSDQALTSIKVVYDKPGRAAFDFTIVTCGVTSGDNPDGSPATTYVKTRIDGKFAYFGDRKGNELNQTSSSTPDADCK